MKTRARNRARWLRIAVDFLTFNGTEQKGAFFLLTILTCLITAQALIPAGTVPGALKTEAFFKEVAEFETAWKAAEEADKLQRKQRFYTGGYNIRRPDSSFRKQKENTPAFVVELNAADTFELQRLRGIGPGFARRITRYRERLGGFIRTSQLLEVFGMDTSRYLGMLPNLTLRTDSVRKIDLNQVTFKEMLKHPYFPFETTRSIMLYRQKNKRFRSVEELKSVNGVVDSVYQKMLPYVKVSE